jgi:hypothetical protein
MAGGRAIAIASAATTPAVPASQRPTPHGGDLVRPYRRVGRMRENVDAQGLDHVWHRENVIEVRVGEKHGDHVKVCDGGEDTVELVSGVHDQRAAAAVGVCRIQQLVSSTPTTIRRRTALAVTMKRPA